MTHRSSKPIALLLFITTLLFCGSGSAAPKVVVSILPIHSLVSGLMSGIGEPYLLLKGNQSPHTMTLKPSDVRAISQADLLVWVGESLESPLNRVIDNHSGSESIISLLTIPNLHLLPVRHDLDWSRHGHSEHHEEAHSDDEMEWDNHIWLSPENARTIVQYLAQVLIRLDTDHTAEYRTNLQKLLQRIDRDEMAFHATISAVKDRPFIVFHDAYHYLEDHFGLNAVGSVSISPERQSGAKHIHKLQQKIRRLEAICVFSEPQFQPKLVDTLTSGTEANAGILDPLGMALTPGPEAYFQLLNGLADNLATCLGGAL
ncbi:MAG: zinc ABC transporter substrate-binding protein [Candidatus Thiodiazotropha lotti]|nr:zinc ABC transporter substrate-binding protein [Candidatus Thiodiazotropha lotti]MCG8001030.1 zinc ABC transporter substrate-binding protein [Candidatus Thiodiazotropha lotti]MCW4182641.1 zinc ABC transporter substrate-binding protein [Candidatus Thiodiazotropha weberae]MCW4192804.1 zinc ABC transporter substrate-binding protein [Candidatus Thiodiazotropha weberae]